MPLQPISELCRIVLLAELHEQIVYFGDEPAPARAITGPVEQLAQTRAIGRRARIAGSQDCELDLHRLLEKLHATHDIDVRHRMTELAERRGGLDVSPAKLRLEEVDPL